MPGSRRKLPLGSRRAPFWHKAVWLQEGVRAYPFITDIVIFCYPTYTDMER
jgi:hypothetical protein